MYLLVNHIFNIYIDFKFTMIMIENELIFNIIDIPFSLANYVIYQFVVLINYNN